MQSDIALLVIDVQLGMFEPGDPVCNGDELLTKLSTLIAEARLAHIPVIHVQHSGGEGHLLNPQAPGWPIHPEVAPTPDELVIHKHHPDSFQETALQQELDRKGIKRLVIAGIQTEYCIDTTCRRAYSLGYKAILVKDAHSTWNSERLQARQIIEHHNQVLGGWFVTLKSASEIDFVTPYHRD